MNAWYSFLVLVCFPAVARSPNTSFTFAIILYSESKVVIIKKNLFKQKSSFIRYFKKLFLLKICYFMPLSDTSEASAISLFCILVLIYSQ